MTNLQNIQLRKTLFKLPNGQYVAPYTDCKGALEVGDIGQSLSVDETQGLRRRLNGQTVAINTNTNEFVTKLHTLKQTYPTLFCTEDEWQDIKESNYLRQCGKFVLQESSTQIRDQYNVGFIGTLQRSHGVVSGFLNNVNSMILQEALPWATATSIEAVFKVDVTSVSVSNVIMGNTGDTATGNGVVFRTDGAARLYVWATTNGSSWTTSQADTGIDLTIGVNYIKVNYDGTNFVVAKSLDGTTWTTGTSIATGAIANCKQWLGSTGSGSALYLRGSMDLTEMYFRVDNDMWCDPFELVTNSVEPYVRLPRVVMSIGNMNYENLNKVGLSNRVLVYTRKPAQDNNFTWCNVYADGWVEQGGAWNSINGEGTGYRTYTVYFPRPFNNTNYTALAMPNYTNGNLYSAQANDRQPDRITFYYIHEQNYTGASWFAAGWSNVPQPDEYNIDSSDVQFPYFIQIAQGQATMTSIRNEWEINNPYTLFDGKQSQYPINNASWLRSNGQWNEKTVYTSAYEALMVELNNSIETGETVNLPSGGRYTKHLQTLNFSTYKVNKEGNPVIEEGILYPTTSDYVQLKAGNDVLTTAKRWQLDMKIQDTADLYAIASNYTSDYIPFAVTRSKLIVNNTALVDETPSVSNSWQYIRVNYNDSTGYTLSGSADGVTYTVVGTNVEVAKVDCPDGLLNIMNLNTDLRTVQFRYTIDGMYEYIVTTGVEYKEAVWNKAEHTKTEDDYTYNFIVDTVNEKFRLPIYDRVINSPYADRYYYVGDVAQNTSLIDVGRISASVADMNSQIEQLRETIGKIAGDVPTVETSTYGYRYVNLYNGVDLGDHSIDLSSYIPLDGHEYDVHGYMNYRVGDTSGNNRNAYIYNADKSQTLVYMGTDGTSSPSSGDTTFSFTIPLSASSRTIVLTLSGTSDYQFNTFKLYMIWFRKY